MKRETGMGSACSSLLGHSRACDYTSCNHTKHNSTVLLLLSGYYYLLHLCSYSQQTLTSMVSYLYCLGTHCKQYAEYLHMQTLQNSPFYAKLTHKSAIFNTL